MDSTHKKPNFFIFELISEVFPQDETPDPSGPVPHPETNLLMIVIGALFLVFGLLFGVFSHP